MLLSKHNSFCYIWHMLSKISSGQQLTPHTLGSFFYMAENESKQEEQEERDGTDWAEIFGHGVRFMILVWSLAMMTLGYMDKIRNDGAFLAGLTSGVLGSYGISVNKKKTNNANAPKIVDNKNNKAGTK